MALITVFETQNITGFSLNSFYGVFVSSVSPMPFQLVDGKEYVIFWDSGSYTRTAFSFTGADGSTCVAVGNKMVSTGENDGDPFAIVCDYTNNYLHYFSAEDNAGHYVGVYQEEGSDIILKDHAGNDLDAIEGIVEIRIPTSDGGVQSFSSGTRVRTTIDPDFSNGDIVVAPNEGEVFNEVTVKKPSRLLPENIAKDVNIAGVVGTNEGSGYDYLAQHLNEELTTYESEQVISIRRSAFSGNNYTTTTIVSAVLPNLKIIKAHAFSNATQFKSLYAPNLEEIWDYAFNNSGIEEIIAPKVKKLQGDENQSSLSSRAFNNCTSLRKADFTAVTVLNLNTFFNCSALETLILRRTDAPVKYVSGALTGTAIANGTGYIYVPRSLLSTYQSASGWSTFSARFRAIESYPDICG